MLDGPADSRDDSGQKPNAQPSDPFQDELAAHRQSAKRTSIGTPAREYQSGARRDFPSADAAPEVKHDRENSTEVSNLPTMTELNAAIKPSHIIGRGGGSTVYNIPGHPDLVVRISTTYHLDGKGTLKPEFAGTDNSPVLVDDPFKGKIHVGQAVAIYRQDGLHAIEVLRKQEGDTVRGSDQIIDRQAHAEKVLRAAAEMPQLVDHPVYGRIDPYVALLRDARLLGEMGAIIDPKANNLVINPGKGFGLVDVATPRGTGPTGVTGPLPLVKMIMDPTVTSGLRIDSTSMASSRRAILERMHKACQSEGIEFFWVGPGGPEFPGTFEYPLKLAGYQGDELRQTWQRYATKPNENVENSIVLDRSGSRVGGRDIGRGAATADLASGAIRADISASDGGGFSITTGEARYRREVRPGEELTEKKIHELRESIVCDEGSTLDEKTSALRALELARNPANAEARSVLAEARREAKRCSEGAEGKAVGVGIVVLMLASYFASYREQHSEQHYIAAAKVN